MKNYTRKTLKASIIFAVLLLQFCFNAVMINTSLTKNTPVTKTVTKALTTTSKTASPSAAPSSISTTPTGLNSGSVATTNSNPSSSSSFTQPTFNFDFSSVMDRSSAASAMTDARSNWGTFFT